MTIFSKIIAGDIPCHKIAENDACIAFLDVSPLVKGHTLVVPKCEIDYIFDLSPEMLTSLMVFAQKTAQALKKAIPCKRIGVAVIGLEVPHTHIHLVPLSCEGDLDFLKERLKFSTEEFQNTAAAIRRCLE
jgi:histidine triad (HIT) family protein